MDTKGIFPSFGGRYVFQYESSSFTFCIPLSRRSPSIIFLWLLASFFGGCSRGKANASFGK